ncbi:hypothetical protein ABEB36_012183 [Hypothenemus hampei]|uniref:Chitin-binding type-2 domain-containing protein n=1 Tax=Hypothenemus hampei TaxID=57062 RepID=A0ABD1EB49_HYPHA
MFSRNDLTRFCLKPTGQFPGRACNRYVNCWAGNAVEQECSGNLLFNPEKLYCDFPVNVNCRRKPDVHIDLRATKFCQKSSGVFPGSSCSKFVNCWNGTAVEQECPDGLFFSTEGYCDYPERVSCGRIEKEVAKECPLEFGTFRNRSDCSRYYICAYNKIAATYKCPDGFSFSDLLGICDYSFRVDCSKEPQIYQRKFVDGNNLLDNAFAHPDLSKPSATGDPRCTVSFGTTRDEKNCSLYYVCEFGNVVATHVCPPGYLYSNIFNACDRAEKVNCQHGPSPTILAFPNLSKDLISKVKKCIPGTTFPLNSDCTIACRCRNGLAEVIQCAAGLAYDSKMDKCLVAYKAQC